MGRLRTNYTRTSITAIMLFVLAACTKPDPLTEEPNGESFNVSLNISGSDVIEVRSAPNNAERKIYHGYFFLFKSDGSYHSHFRFDDSDVMDNETTSPKLILPNATRIVTGSKIVIIINEEAVDDSGLTISTYSNVFSLFTLSENKLVDAANGGAATVKMPMYGEVDSWTAGGSIDIKHSLAKIQLKLASDITISTTAGTSFDDVTKIHYKIYNNATRGRINGYEHQGQGNPVTSITWPAEANTNDVTKIGTAEDNDFVGASYIYPYATRDRYLPYTQLGVWDPHPSRLAIIVKANTKYYRLDFYKKGYGYPYLDGNTHYKIIIKKVTGPGYDTATDALLYPPSNLVYTLHADNSGGDVKAGTTTKDNGVVSLSVNSRYDNYLTSDGSGGWTIKVYMDAFYKTFTPANSSVSPSSEAVKQTHRLITTGHGLTVTGPHGTVGTSNLNNGVYWTIDRRGADRKTTDLTFEIKVGTLAIQKTVRVIYLGTNQSSDCFGVHNIELYNPYGSGATFNDYTWFPNNVHIGRNHTVSYDAVRKLSIADNMTPVSWSSTAYSGVPTFGLRYVHGSLNVNFSNGTVKTFMDRVDQQPPHYVGRIGSEITMANASFGHGDEISTPTSRKYKHAIVSRFDSGQAPSWQSNQDDLGTVKVNWINLESTTGDGTYSGWQNAENLRMNGKLSRALPINICQRLNGYSGTGITTWYLGASEQMRQLGARATTIGLVSNQLYYASSENWTSNRWGATRLQQNRTQIDWITKIVGYNHSIRCMREF